MEITAAWGMKDNREDKKRRKEKSWKLRAQKESGYTD